MKMRGLLWLAFLLTVAVAIAVAGRLETGQVLILYAPYQIDMSLNLFGALLIATFIALYVSSRALVNLLKLPARLAAYRTRAHLAKTHAALIEALRNLFAGRFAHAEKAARTASASKDNKSAAALISAACAHRMRAYARRDEWLAQITSAHWQRAKWMATAEMRADAHDAAGALAALDQIQTQRCTYAQQIALRAHRQLHHWPAVLQLVQALAARAAIHPAKAQRLRQMAAEEGLRARRNDAEAMIDYWQSLPEDLRLAAPIADLAAQLLLSCGRFQEAQRIVEDALAQHWDARLLHRYIECAGDHPALLIQRAQAWQAAHADDPDLLFALGCLCQQQELWGKAQAFLEQALRLAEHSQYSAALRTGAHRALARLHETLGHDSEANAHYRASALEAPQ